MKTKIRKLPIGVQNFEIIRSEDYLYIDKTSYIYQLVHYGKAYFLSRPRRFGKSLFLSTLRAYWEGKRELFKGLEIEELEADDPEAWQTYPVFYFDFNKKNYQRETALEEVLDSHLKDWEEIYGDERRNTPLEERFQHLIVQAVKQTGKKAVVLVDEYDKSLLEAIVDEKLEEHNKAVFKGFFSTLKSYDEYLKFVFLTGVTKFSKVSIFSDLNHLNDISMDEDFAGICGITEAEMRAVFMPEIEQMAKKQELTVEECLSQLKDMYDGYHFHQDTPGLYNPFSLINALSKCEFGAYWFSTGTPTFLIEKLKSVNYDIKEFTGGDLYADASTLSDYRADNPDPIPLFYQSGYLTIKGYDRKYRSYQLGYPNSEVKYGFIESLVPMVFQKEDNPDPLDIRRFGKDIEQGNTVGLKDRFIALFARLPYREDNAPLERDFQNVIYIVFMLLGQFVHTEMHTSKGRCDCVVETDNYIYVFEFKRDGTAKEALEQIEEKGYAKPYAADERTILKVGAVFDSVERNLTEWVVAISSLSGR